MCGIAGVLTREPAHLGEGIVLAMRGEIAHRGPDDAGMHVDPAQGLGLAQTRLSILDLSPAGHQPMWNADRTACVVFNGEIYNFRELRDELAALGHVATTRTDTEVLLLGYAAWGRDVVQRLNGMFAFAIWDARAGELFVARDRLGVKPLYYHFDAAHGTLVFASELKALLPHPAVDRAVDPAALQCYLTIGYVPAPLSIFAAVRKLPAGHQIVVRRGEAPEPRPYWRITRLGEAHALPMDEAKREVRARLERAVERRLVSDVPVGAFLSGGVDSTLICALMGKLMAEPLHTFSLAYDVGPRSAKYNVDADAADVVSRRLGTRHTRVTLGPELDVMATLRASVRHMDEPHYNPTNLATYLLAGRIREAGITVVLSGDGSDEIFGGYARYGRDLLVSRLQALPGFVRRAARAAFGRGEGPVATALRKAELPARSAERLMDWGGLFDEGERAAMLTPAWSGHAGVYREMVAALAAEAPGGTNQDLMTLADLSFWITNESNMRLDKMTMAHAIETRSPFLDYELVEYAMAIPFHRKAAPGRPKHLLKAAFADVLPPEVARREKWGWMAPSYYWMKDRIWPETRALVASLPETGMFTPEVARHVAELHPPDFMRIWALLVLAVWAEEFLRVPAAPPAR